MATLGECRFCKQITAYHTHDECANEYGSEVEKAILDHYKENPSKPLPPIIQKQLKSEDWKYYSDLKNWNANLTQHVDLLKRNIQSKAEEILESNRAEFKKLLLPYEHKTFLHHIKCEVSVRIEPRF